MSETTGKRSEDLPCDLGLVLVAGGQGRRFGADRPKQFLPLAGKPVLQWSLDCFAACSFVTEMVVVLPDDWVPWAGQHLRFPAGEPVVRVVPGGAERQDSVQAGLDALATSPGWVAVHDGARPGISPDMVKEAYECALSHGSAVCALPCRDTIVSAEGDRISRHQDRERLRLLQTPQIFRLGVLKAALANARKQGIRGTDDSFLVRTLGEDVHLVEGSERNRKITTAEDVAVVAALLTGSGSHNAS